jgi:hypothetical protein
MSNDDETSPLLLPLPIEVMSVILCEVNKTDTIFELQSKHNIVEGAKSKKEGRPDPIDTDLDSYLNQYSYDNVVEAVRSASTSYVSNNSGWGYGDDGEGMSIGDMLNRLRNPY